jgi:hypothetical protein
MLALKRPVTPDVFLTWESEYLGCTERSAVVPFQALILQKGGPRVAQEEHRLKLGFQSFMC